MLPLKIYVSKQHKYNSDNNVSLLSEHFCIEFFIRDALDKSYVSINEKYGVYNGQIEFVVEIAKAIVHEIEIKSGVDSFSISKDDLEDSGYTGNIFFNTIRILYTSKQSGYVSNKSKIDKQTQLFANVEIVIDNREYTTYEDICLCLVHELTHAWEDYNRQLNGDEYSLCEITKTSKYYNIIKQETDSSLSNIRTICKRIEYHLTNFEVNAYLAELASVLKTNKNKIQTYKDAVKLFEETEVWGIYSWLYDLVCHSDDDYFNNLTKEYNSINHTNFTANKLRKKLKDRFRSVFGRIARNVPKLYYEYYSEQQYKEGLIHRKGKSIISLLEVMKNYTTPIFIKKSYSI